MLCKLALVLAFAAGVAPFAAADEADFVPADRPVEVPAEGYVGSETCRACHPGRHASWSASYHRRMTQVVSPETVVGRFDGEVLRSNGRSVRMVERDGEYFVEDASGSESRRIVLSTGSHHQQFYWYATGRSRRVGLAGFVYLIPEDRWIPYSAVGLGPPPSSGSPLSPKAGIWNQGCMHCHTTNGRMRIDLAAASGGRGAEAAMDTQVSEFGIACEACHGPGGEHVARNRDPQRRYRQHLLGEEDASIVNPAKLSPRRASQVCGQCHSVHLTFKPEEGAGHLNAKGFRYRPGQDLHATRAVLQPDESGRVALPKGLRRQQPDFERERFWSDGMVRVSGREYNGLLKSPCFRDGEDAGDMSCLSCHVMHREPEDPRSDQAWAEDQLGPGMRGDAACLQCHADLPRGLSEDGLDKHTKHAAGSAGSRCLNCHMPYTSYGLLKAIRSHTVSSPSARESVETGRPNACNQCHLDRSLGWTAAKLEQQYGTPPPALDADQAEVPAGVLWALRGDAGQRALVAWNLGWKEAQESSGTRWMPRVLAELLNDPYPAVRVVAGRSLSGFPGYSDLAYDSEATPGARLSARAEVRRRWRAAVAIDPDAPGSRPDAMSAEAYRRLLAARDQRPLSLRE